MGELQRVKGKSNVGCLGWTVLIIGALLIIGLLFPHHDPKNSTGTTLDAGAQQACTDWGNFLGDVKAGVLTNDDLRVKVERIYGRVSSQSQDTSLITDVRSVLADLTQDNNDSLKLDASAVQADCT